MLTYIDDAKAWFTYKPILQIVHDRGAITPTQLFKESKKYKHIRYIKDVISKLEQGGFIKRKQINNRMRTIELTKKGEHVLQYKDLMEASHIISYGYIGGIGLFWVTKFALRWLFG